MTFMGIVGPRARLILSHPSTFMIHVCDPIIVSPCCVVATTGDSTDCTVVDLFSYHACTVDLLNSLWESYLLCQFCFENSSLRVSSCVLLLESPIGMLKQLSELPDTTSSINLKLQTFTAIGFFIMLTS